MSAPGEDYNYLQLGLEKAIEKIRVAKEAQAPYQEVLAVQFENFAAAFMTILGMIGTYNSPILMSEAKRLALSTLGVTAAAFGEHFTLEELTTATQQLHQRGQLKGDEMKKT